MLKRREESNTYLTHVCRHRWSRKSLVKIEEIGAFANTVTFISYRCRLTKVLADATRGEKGSKGGGKPSKAVKC